MVGRAIPRAPQSPQNAIFVVLRLLHRNNNQSHFQLQSNRLLKLSNWYDFFLLSKNFSKIFIYPLARRTRVLIYYALVRPNGSDIALWQSVVEKTVNVCVRSSKSIVDSYESCESSTRSDATIRRFRQFDDFSKSYSWEFDSGSERTLVAWIRHASRTGSGG